MIVKRWHLTFFVRHASQATFCFLKADRAPAGWRTSVGKVEVVELDGCKPRAGSARGKGPLSSTVLASTDPSRPITLRLVIPSDVAFLTVSRHASKASVGEKKQRI